MIKSAIAVELPKIRREGSRKIASIPSWASRATGSSAVFRHQPPHRHYRCHLPRSHQDSSNTITALVLVKAVIRPRGLFLPFLAPQLLRLSSRRSEFAGMGMVGMTTAADRPVDMRKRTHATHNKHSEQNSNASLPTASTSKDGHLKDENKHGHDHDHHDDHEHGHSIFHSHSRSFDDGHSQQVKSIVNIFEGKLDRGSRVTIIGLSTNIVLTASKGLAGWFMNSAALLAEAGHSASDLVGDLVTLLSWRFSKRPPTSRYPYGFGKFETLGTTTVALLLIGGAFGIGFHSLHLLIHHLTEAAATLPHGPAQIAIQNVTSVAQSVSNAVGVHGHSHVGGNLDPNAAWFAAASVVTKEWVYRVTKRVADEERSPVLLANAIHHRSDAYTSAVALVAILGTWYFPALPLDPIGGMLVSFIILKQGISLFAGAFGELTDASVTPRTHNALIRALAPLHSPSPSSKQNLVPLLGIGRLRAQRSGANIFVDVDAWVPSSLNMEQAAAVESRIRNALCGVRSEIVEVRVKFLPSPEEFGTMSSRADDSHSSTR